MYTYIYIERERKNNNNMYILSRTRGPHARGAIRLQRRLLIVFYVRSFDV